MRSKFDRDFERVQRGFWFGWIFSIVIGLGMLFGCGFVVYKLLIYFGVM